MSAKRAALALGHAYRSGTWWRCRCPVHRSSGATLAIKNGRRGLIVFCHAGCRTRDIYNELRRLDLLGEGLGVVPETSMPTPPCRTEEEADWHRARRILNAMDIWGQAYSPGGTVVARYWRARGLTIPIPPSIRMHGVMPHRESGEQRPAMTALVEHSEYGCVAVHCTFLAVDGSMKATIEPNKKSFGPVRGGAVRIGSVREGQWLVVGEGIESTASAMELWDISSGWAALSAPGLRNVILPPEAQSIVIACDNDENGVGQAAARDAAWLWQNEGRTVRVALPPKPGIDFNDILNGTN